MKITLATFCVVAGFVVAVGCGGGNGDETLEGDGYSFTFPGDWEPVALQDVTGRRGEPLSEATVAPEAEEEGGRNYVTLFTNRLPVSISESNIDEFESDIATQVRQLFEPQGGSVERGPTPVTMGGLPGFRFDLASPLGAGARVRVILVFDGTTQYSVQCQFTPEGAEEMKRGCDQVVESFQVE